MPTIEMLRKVCRAFKISLADFFATGNMVEVTPDVKALHEQWLLLSQDEKDIIMTHIKSYTGKR